MFSKVISYSDSYEILVAMLTSSKNSGSVAEASQRLFSINMFGFDSLVDTLWKKFFSYSTKNFVRRSFTCVYLLFI